MRTISRQARVGVAIGIVCAVAAGCSLGLDQSLIGGAEDGGNDGPVAQVDGSVPKVDGGTPAKDAGGDSGLATTCAKDIDCFSNQACLTGRCDLARGACVYDVCPTKGTTCSSSVCTNGTCGAPVVQKFAGNKISVPAGMTPSCGAPQKCFAAVHPWVFVGTNAGVLAYPAIPADPNPAPVVVSNLPFLAQSIAVSGNRVFVLGGIQNFGFIKVQIAWFDAPLDPLTKTITAQSSLVTTNHATGDILLPMPALSALLTQQGQPNPLFTGSVVAPFTPQSTISQVDVDAGALASQTGSTTGSRLALFKTNGASSDVQLVTNAGTPTQAVSAPLDTTALLPGGVQAYNFATGADGSLRIHYYTAIPMGMVTQYKTHVGELFENGTATTLSAKFPVVDIDTYTTPLGGAFLGTVAWVDSSSVLTVSSTPPTSVATSSHVLWIDNKKSAPKSLNLMTTSYQNVGVTGSAGIGWALTNDSPGAQPGAASLYYLSPLCAP